MRDRALVGNSADATQVRNAKDKEKLARERAQDDLQALLQLPAFRRFVWRLSERLRVWSSPFDKNPYQHAFNSGEKNAGLALIAELEAASPDAFLQMMQDAKTEEKKYG